MRGRELDPVVVGLAAFGFYLVAIGLFGALAPGPFFEGLGRFGPRNDHYIHDVAAFQLATGFLLLLAVGKSAWRAPALVLASLQFGLHAVSHAVDLPDADPEWVGVAELVGLIAATSVLIWLTARVGRASSPTRPA